ncbi:hypothetical protein AV530_001578 [Patagioenas fasciata monilis]|uniref:Uncharacterized protein n=1 Tax=Patagioenas fasciata monilis TaxID=372326 RepID=A0A1V4K583_PATFA|nr:hypothetical protein AV530_001578 [Patagioenas fasciata monilis]
MMPNSSSSRHATCPMEGVWLHLPHHQVYMPLPLGGCSRTCSQKSVGNLTAFNGFSLALRKHRGKETVRDAVVPAIQLHLGLLAKQVLRILSANTAETSITVNYVGFVVDSGKMKELAARLTSHHLERQGATSPVQFFLSYPDVEMLGMYIPAAALRMIRPCHHW